MRPLVSIGQQFGRWTVLGIAPTRRSPGGSLFVYWHCCCACGTLSQVRQRHLLSGRTLSCGCWKSEAATSQKTTHGGRGSLLYEVWTQMLQRCENQNNRSYCRYGARGISVCPEWHDFAVFRAWAMAHGYAEGLTIDREENDGDYKPGNCRWVSNLANSRNTSVVLKVMWNGAQVALNDLADAHGIRSSTVYSRFRLKGWTLRQALGIDPAPPLQRAPYGAETKQRMRQAALLRWQRERAEVKA